jgi:uroporphyrinogen III methyltransferase/synthase
MPDESGGIVYLVGAGPGDPGLLTVRARELMRSCDALVHDALVSAELLSAELGAREVAPEIHDVGKRGGGRSTPQQEIEALLVRLAREGKRVVRLKGGDPMVFGRGGEEAQRLAHEGIPFEIVPGVTAGVAAAAYAGIPVTHRGVATSVTFVTGHEDPTRPASGTDWQALARAGGTIVLYMGVGRLAPITEALVAGGLAPDTPAAAIEWGTHPRQRTVVATLESIYEHARAAEIGAPAITVIGDVVRLRREIAWFDRRPLFGRRIVVTRARAQASALAERLRTLGAEVLEAPTIRIERLDDAPTRARLTSAGAYDWLVVTSANAVAIVRDVLREAGLDARALGGVRVAAVGPATAAALESTGIVPDVVPDRFVAEGLIEALAARRDVRGARVLYAGALGARDVLPIALGKLGAEVETLALYRSVPDERGLERLRAAIDAGAVDLVTFTSASTARHFAGAVGAERVKRIAGASIGPITSQAARAEGIPVRIEAAASTIDGLVRAIVQHANATGGEP